jgi:hypothetical protein
MAATPVAGTQAPQAAVEKVRKWTFADVVGRFEPIAQMAERHGLLASLFGSTLERGIGNDLDVLMTARREMEPDREGFLAEFGGVEVNSKVNEAKGISCIKLAKDGRYYDFVFGTVSGKPRGM